MLAKAGVDLLFPRKAQNESLKDYIIEKYGKTLFEVFFRPYSEKFLDYTCANLHRDWAEAGINRATIDKQIKTNSLLELIKSVLFRKNPGTKFLYPLTGGIGSFCDRLADKVKQNKGRILLSSRIEKFETKNGYISSVMTDHGEVIDADYVFWSGSLQDLHSVGEMPESIPRMHYVSTILFNYLISGHISQKFQWCYYGDAEMEVDRISVPRHFNPNTVPEGKEALCIEITCEENSPFWSDPSRADCVIETFMLRAKLIDSLDRVEDVRIEKVSRTYPLYALNYPRKLRVTFDWVEAEWQNLSLLGRTGRFWYNNMDHSISASLQVAERFIGDYQKGVLQKPSRYSIEDRYFRQNSQ
jgi:protoporphyrinogen oxidase